MRPILGGILSLASTTETVQRGVGLLIAYSAGLGVPFILSALALQSFLRFFKRYRPFIPVVERAAGVVMIVVGVLVFTNYYVVLNALSFTPEWRSAGCSDMGGSNGPPTPRSSHPSSRGAPRFSGGLPGASGST